MDDVERATQAASAAAYRLDALTGALRVHLDHRSALLLEDVLDAAVELTAAEQIRVIHELAAAFPGVGPAIVMIGNEVRIPSH